MMEPTRLQISSLVGRQFLHARFGPATVFVFELPEPTRNTPGTIQPAIWAECTWRIVREGKVIIGRFDIPEPSSSFDSALWKSQMCMAGFKQSMSPWQFDPKRELFVTGITVSSCCELKLFLSDYSIIELFPSNSCGCPWWLVASGFVHEPELKTGKWTPTSSQTLAGSSQSQGLTCLIGRHLRHLANPGQDGEGFVFGAPDEQPDSWMLFQVPWSSWAFREGEAMLTASGDCHWDEQCMSVDDYSESKVGIFANALDHGSVGDNLCVSSIRPGTGGRVEIDFISGRSLVIFPAISGSVAWTLRSKQGAIVEY